MKVKELIEELQKLDPELQLICQKDSEGNGYSPLAGADLACYVEENTWSGTVYDLSWSADDADCDDKEWEEIKKNKVVVLFPVN